MKRILTALVLIPVVTYVAIWGADWLFLLVTAAVAVLCFREFSSISAAYGYKAPALLGYAAGLVILLVPRGDLLLACLIVLAGLSLALRSEDLAKALPGAAMLAAGVLYVFGPWRSALALRAVSPYWLFLALALNWVGDTAAFYAGRALGRHKLAPRLSPGKSWEGSIASLAGSLLFGFFYLAWLLPETTPVARLAICGAGNVAGQVGDLAESLMKRGAGLKDSGNLLPGHGGWLDRLDSTLFALPVVHVLLVAFGWAR